MRSKNKYSNNHNYNKIRKSDLPSALISALIGQFNMREPVMPE